MVCYKKSVILYDMTIYYIDKYLQPSDRTYGQMQQAARSGKQNIVEGLEDKMTSTDTGSMWPAEVCKSYARTTKTSCDPTASNYGHVSTNDLARCCSSAQRIMR